MISTPTMDMMRNYPSPTLQLDGTTHDISNLLLQKDVKRIGDDRLRWARLYPDVNSLDAATETVPQHRQSSSPLEFRRPSLQQEDQELRLIRPFADIDNSKIHFNPHHPITEEDEEEFEPAFREWVKVTPSLKLPLLSSKETICALKEKRIARHECSSCTSILGCIDTAHYVVCNNCRCVMPTSERGVGGINQYVGLGFYYNLYNEGDSPQPTRCRVSLPLAA